MAFGGSLMEGIRDMAASSECLKVEGRIKKENIEEVMEPEPQLVQSGVPHLGSEELVPVDVA